MSIIDWSQKITPAMQSAEHAKSVRTRRDAELAKSGWIVERHRDELEHLPDTTLAASQYTDLQNYRQQLRDWPAQPGWPDIDMPSAPEWLPALIKS